MIRARVDAELAAQGIEFGAAHLERLEITPLPQMDELRQLVPRVREFGVDEVIHCAACLDYFDRAALEAVNIGLTRHLVELALNVGVEKFILTSTAFSSGYMESAVPETLHDEPLREPTDYTRTKRAAERIVANSGLPYLILRPSIVVGDSRYGRYCGKRYGLYQLWSGIERLLCREWQAEIHVLAPRRSLVNLVHQDAFLSAFLAAYRWLPENSIVNVVSDGALAPTVRQLWDLWLDACNRPRQKIYYERMADIPIRTLPAAQRALIALASVNLEIISHPWSFDTSALTWLRHRGLDFCDGTLDTVAICQSQFIAYSDTIQRFLSLRQEPPKVD
jgi:nucleoside-diphosphate-sugar epimerase